MSALPATVAPVALSLAARAAADVDPRQVLERWYAGLGKHARYKYGVAMRRFAAWATGQKEPSADVALRVLVDAGRAGARGMVLGWRHELEAQGKASATVASSVSALASCITAARLAGLVEWSLEKVAPKIEAREDRSGPARHEVELLLSRLDDEVEAGSGAEQVTQRTALAIRDVAIVRLLHNAALRRFEVAGLRLCDVQLDHADGPRVRPLRKGHQEREEMLVSQLTAESLRRWLAIRGTTRPDAPLFTRLRARQDPETAGALSFEAIRQMLHKRAKQAGVRAVVRPHGLRHSAATHCARNASLAALKRLGGWTTLTSPARYMDRDDRDRRTALAVVEC